MTDEHRVDRPEVVPVGTAGPIASGMSVLERAALGAAAGLVGTLALQGLRSASQRLAPKTMPRMNREPGSFMVERAEMLLPERARDRIPQRAEELTSNLLALAYGITPGVAYALLRPHPKRPIAEGAALGVAVWAAGYLGWLPALGLTPSVRDQKLPQVVAPALRHAMFGLIAAWSYSRFRSARA